MRQAARTDDNHEAIVRALRGVGAFVQSLAAVGKGCPDLVVCHRGKVELIEVKNLDGKGRALSPDERDWHALALARGRYYVHVVVNAEQALDVVGVAAKVGP